MEGKWSITPDELSTLVKDRDSGGDPSEKIVSKYGGVLELAEKLQVDVKLGLREQDFENRKKWFGMNVIPERRSESLLSFWLGALTDKTLIILCVSAVISIVLGLSFPPSGESRSTSWIEGGSILMAVFLVSGVTALNDWTKDKKFRKLSEAAEDRKTHVLRDGENTQISTVELLVGDIVLLEPGDYIPADLLLITGHNILPKRLRI